MRGKVLKEEGTNFVSPLSRNPGYATVAKNYTERNKNRYVKNRKMLSSTV